jgi:phosphatidate phosphatase APP1
METRPESAPDPKGWLKQAALKLQHLSEAAGEDFHAGLARLRGAKGIGSWHIEPFRGMVDGDGHCTLSGRVLERPYVHGPGLKDDWWDNLLSAYRRFDSEPMPGVGVDVTFREQTVTVATDAEGYYEAAFAFAKTACNDLWQTAEVRRSDGGKVFLQQVQCVPEKARFGVISDIDDTVLESNISNWQGAIQTTFLRNARTRRPLEGVAKLYQAFQKGRDGSGPNPIFYVSASPWNVYDLLVDFMALNDIPDGPIQLRDVDFSTSSFLQHAGPKSKLGKIHDIIGRYPHLSFVLVGDSGQIDADLYAQTVEKFPGRILAVYNRDIDEATDTARDRFVDAQIKRIAGSKVPMLMVSNSNAIAEHARQLGLVEPEEIPKVEKEVEKDQARPDAAQVVQDKLGEKAAQAFQPPPA